jgi:hypothetical protein
MSSPKIKSEDGGGQKKLPQITLLDDDDKNDDSSSVSSVNAVNGVDYFGEEERRMSGGDDDVSTQGKSDEATHAKHKHHPTKKNSGSGAAAIVNRGVQSAVKLEDDADDMKDTSAGMKDNTVAVEQIDASQKQPKEREQYQGVAVATATTVDRINDRQLPKEKETKETAGDADLKQRGSVATTAAAAIPMYSLLTSEEDDSGNEDSDINSSTNKEGARPLTAWNLFNMAMRGKGLTGKQVVRIHMLVCIVFSLLCNCLHYMKQSLL